MFLSQIIANNKGYIIVIGAIGYEQAKVILYMFKQFYFSHN